MKYVLVVMTCCLLVGCLSPAYKPPVLNEAIPPVYKEEGNWKMAQPQDSLDRGDWWLRFNDPVLTDLIIQANKANQNIAVAAANFRQARTQIATARSAFMPGVTLPASYTRSGSENLPGHQTRTSVGVQASWEVSFWNAIPAFESAKAQTEASAADYGTMRLSIQAELAQTYFQLRTLDSQMELYDTTVAAYAKAVQLTGSQYRGGLATPSDVSQAEAQLASAEAELTSLQRQRSQLEHAIAVLVGKLPSSFSLEKKPLAVFLPQIPLSVPSKLLERRPDVAAAERRVASANEQIGVARAAWFPSISLGGNSSLQGVGWHSASTGVWSVGPSLALSLFEGGKRLAANQSAWAQYEGVVASYRQTVLEAFKDVEDNLSALRYLEGEAEARNRAVTASGTALRLSLAQYREGMTTYLQVVSTQTTKLSNERSAISVEGQRLIAAVNLIKALGGGWEASEMQSMRDGNIVPQEGIIQ